MKKKILVICSIVFAVLLIGLGILTINYVNNDANENIIVNSGVSSGIRITGKKNRANVNSSESYTLSATIESVGSLVNDDIDWTIAWNGTNSGTVTDYVTMTISEDTHSVVLTFVQAFTTQIKVTATLQIDSTFTGSATIDYVKHTTDLTISATGTSESYTVDNSNNIITLNNCTGATLKDGTSKLKVTVNPNKIGTYGSGKVAWVALSFSDELEAATGITGRGAQYNFANELVSIGWALDIANLLKDEAFVKAAANVDHWFDLTIKYDDHNISSTPINSYQEVYKIYGIDITDLITVNSFSLNETEIYFE